MNRIFCRNFVFFFLFRLIMQISQIWMQIKDILSVFVKQWVLFYQYPEHQLFFFSTTVANSSRRLSPLSYRA